MDYIYQNTKPENLQAEIDTYWVQYGGANPVAWCEKLTGRLPLLHLKDYGIPPAAEASGCEYYIVEQDTCPGDPFDSIKKSYDYLSGRYFNG